VRSRFIVVLSPRRDRCLRFLVGFEPMLPNAFELERPHERFRDAILLRTMRQNELLIQAVELRELTVEFGGVD
jgi:hypothetical protein